MLTGSIKNLIFDLGGVVIDLDLSATFSAFAKLSGSTLEQTILHQNLPFFMQYEKGLITSSEFRDQFRALIDAPLTDESIDVAWSAMLKDIPAERILLIEELKPYFNMVVLSNTNEIHIQEFNKILSSESTHNSLHSLFDQVYFSYEVGMRKPDANIFEYVLKNEGWKADETLLLDDTIENLETASSLGIQVVQITSAYTINRTFKEWKN